MAVARVGQVGLQHQGGVGHGHAIEKQLGVARAHAGAAGALSVLQRERRRPRGLGRSRFGWLGEQGRQDHAQTQAIALLVGQLPAFEHIVVDDGILHGGDAEAVERLGGARSGFLQTLRWLGRDQSLQRAPRGWLLQHAGGFAIGHRIDAARRGHRSGADLGGLQHSAVDPAVVKGVIAQGHRKTFAGCVQRGQRSGLFQLGQQQAGPWPAHNPVAGLRPLGAGRDLGQHGLEVALRRDGAVVERLVGTFHGMGMHIVDARNDHAALQIHALSLRPDPALHLLVTADSHKLAVLHRHRRGPRLLGIDGVDGGVGDHQICGPL